MIGVNWGTTNFRAYRFDLNGSLIDQKSLAKSILAVENEGFYEAIFTQVGDWINDGETRILMCGMIGSRQGWKEVPYVPAPAGTQEIFAGTLCFDVQNEHFGIIPGVSCMSSEGAPELMRGEETEILGVLGDGASLDGIICLPGTHAKWATIRKGRVERFRTCMTGEVYEALRKHTILGRLMQSATTILIEAYRDGLRCAGGEGGLLHHLFSVRTLVLAGEMSKSAAASYLSGILIGHEVRDMMPVEQVNLVGAPELCALYAEALRVHGVTSRIELTDAGARGLVIVGRKLGWI